MVPRQRHPSNRTRPLRPPTDYVLGRDAEEANGYDVAPSEGKSLAQLNQDLRPIEEISAGPEEAETPAGSPRLQFSLRDLLIISTFASVGLAAIGWLPPGYFAGVAGLVAFVALLVLDAWQPKDRATQLVFWAIVTVYVFAAIGTLVAQPGGR